MFISHRNAIEKKQLKSSQLKHVEKQILIGPDQGWDDYVMRLFTLGEEGYTPLHSHEWPHISYVVEGRGIIHMDGTDHEISAGSTAFVPPNSKHQFRNTGADQLVFICIVPENGDT